MLTLHDRIHDLTGHDINRAASLSTQDVQGLLLQAAEHDANGNARRLLVAAKLKHLLDVHRARGGRMADFVQSQPFGLGRSSIYKFLAAFKAIQAADDIPDDLLNVPLGQIPHRLGQPSSPPRKTQRTMGIGEIEKAIQVLHRALADQLRAHSEVKGLAQLYEVLGDILHPPAANDDDAEAVDPHESVKSAPRPQTPQIKSSRKAKISLMPGLFPQPGGKRCSARELLGRIGQLGPEEVFVEPFLGGGVVALNMLRWGLASRVRLNDADAAVAAYWTAVIRQPEALAYRIHGWECSFEAACQAMKALRAGTLEGVDLALAHLISRRTTFRALGRAAGSPCKKNLDIKWKPDCDVDNLWEAHRVLKGQVVGDRCTSSHAIDVLSEGGRKFAFLDPPYVEQGPDMYRDRFSVHEHKRLAQALHQADYPWLACYDDALLIRKLYDGSVLDRVAVSHTSTAVKGGKGKTRRPELRISHRVTSSSSIERLAA